MKIKGEWNQGIDPRNGKERENRNSVIGGKAIRTMFRTIRSHVEGRLSIDRTAKSVINLSGGELPVDLIAFLSANVTKMLNMTRTIRISQPRDLSEGSK